MQAFCRPCPAPRDLFFSSPQWLPEKQRYEQYAEFTARIAADHDTALAFFRDQLHTEPLAFFTLRARPADDPFRTDADATGGARAWIAGSSSFHEGTFDTRFRLVRGDLTVYLRFKADDDWLRFSLSDTGHAHLSTSAAGGEPQTLATDLLDGIGDLHTTHQLLVSIRDNLFYARLDGRLLFNGPVLLPPATLATPLAAIILAIAFLLQYLDGDHPRPLWNLLNRLPPVLQGCLAALLLTIILGLGPDGVAPFIYFQF